MMKYETIDSYDKAILDQLSTNGRITITELSRIIGLSKTPCKSRIKRLEAEGYITGYRALLNPIKLGLDHIAFVEVKLANTHERALREFNSEVLQIKGASRFPTFHMLQAPQPSSQWRP